MSHKGKPLLLHSEYWRQRPALPGAHLPCSLPWKNGHSLLCENHEPKLNGLCNYIKMNETPIWNSILFSRVIGHASTTQFVIKKKICHRHFKAYLNEKDDRLIFRIQITPIFKTTYIVKMTQSNHKQESLLLFRFI